MDTEIADTVRYITLLQTLFSTWVIIDIGVTVENSYSKQLVHDNVRP